jgi:hypothetical protein
MSMSETATIDPTKAEPAPNGVCARDIEILEKLAEIGMELALITRRRAVDAEAARLAGDPAPVKDYDLVFARIERSVRLTLAFKAELIADGGERLRKDMAERAARMEAARLAREAKQKARVNRAVREVIASKPRERKTRDDLIYELNKRLENWDAATDFRAMTTGEIIERFCKDLRIEPDWTRWWNEAWAIEEGWIGPGHTIATGPP